MLSYTVMMPAAGSGKRMGAGFNKLFLQLGGKPILIHTLEVFERDPLCEAIILAVKEEERETIQSYIDTYGLTKVRKMVEGGAERQQSVSACLRAFDGEEGIVLVHDAARPFIRRTTVHQLVEAAIATGAAIAGVKAKDTMKLAPNGLVESTVNRDQLWMIQTPQAFRYTVLVEASERAEAEGFLGTDESMLVERLGHPVQIVEATYDNVKMTTQEDLAIGEVLLARVLQEEEK